MRRTIFATGVLGAALVVVLVAGWRVQIGTRDRAVEQFQALQLEAAETVATLLENDLTDAAQLLQVVGAATSGTPRVDRSAVGQVHRRCDRGPCVAGAAVFTADGAAHTISGRGVDVAPASLRAALDWARDAPPDAIRTVVVSSQPAAVVLFAPAQQVPGGVIAVALDLDPLFRHDTASAHHPWANCDIVAVAANGTAAFHLPSGGEARDLARRLAASRAGVAEYSDGGTPELVAIAERTVNGDRWVVAMRTPRDRVTALLGRQMWQLGVLLASVILLVAVAAAITWHDGRLRVRAETEARDAARIDASHGELTALNARLERAAHEWRTTADTIDAALIVLEPNGVIVRMNVAAAATLPDALPSWLGRPSARLIEHEPWDAAMAMVSDAVDQQIVTRRVRGKANRTWDLWCREMPGMPRATVVVMARDVTEVIELQESVRRSETMAQLGSIVSGVAHEVRNPLFAISSLVDAWAVQPHRDSRPFVDALRSEVARLRTLMVDLLEYGRPPTRTRQAQELAGVIEGAVRACAHEAAARGVHVVTSASADVQVLMESRRLERVFINLIQNAIQHAPAESLVRVETTAPAPGATHAAVAVRDSGKGFAPEDLGKVFTPFFSRRPGGFGLGLAIAERIVAEHGGRAAAANDPAGGAVMTVWLPVVADPRAAGRKVVERG